MNIDCRECGDKLLHYHCRYCRCFLSQIVDRCPRCGIDKPVEKAKAGP